MKIEQKKVNFLKTKELDINVICGITAFIFNDYNKTIKYKATGRGRVTYENRK